MKARTKEAQQRSDKGRALFYSRDSGGEHDQTPAEYVRWAQRRARELGVAFRGTAEIIDDMMTRRLPVSGDVFLDLCVQGHLLSRPALDALKMEIARDPTVSHVFIPRRDRLARPNDPVDGLTLEKELRDMGVWLIFMDRALGPLSKRDRRDVGEMILGLIDYDQSGRFRTELAEKMIFAQLSLAKAGYSTGGRPPFGYRRWLVDDAGNRIRQLDDGEVVRKRGNHVLWLPGPEKELDLIRRIIEMLMRMPATQVARQLTAEGVPAPDAGRTRTDNGVPHQVRGIWHATTISGIARNPLNRALVTYGRRSMGDQRRMTPDGPRGLHELDTRPDGKPKVVQNANDRRVTVPAAFEPVVPVEQMDKLLTILDQRAGTQRGKPRSKNPATNPLGCRIHDLACSWPMYRQPHGKSFRYTCGLYQQSHGQECAHNHLDGPTASRFVLAAIQQRLLTKGRLRRLEEKIEAKARAESAERDTGDEIAAKRSQLMQLRGQLERVERNMALAETDEQFQAISKVFTELQSAVRAAEAQLADLERQAKPISVQVEVDKALGLVRRLSSLAEDPANLAALGNLFQLVNAQLYVQFQPVKKLRRIENKLSGGILTFGNATPPITKYEGPTGRRPKPDSKVGQAARHEKCCAEVREFVDFGGRNRSLGNVSRGDRI